MSDNKEIQATTPSEDIKVSDSSLATEDETKTEAVSKYLPTMFD